MENTNNNKKRSKHCTAILNTCNLDIWELLIISYGHLLNKKDIQLTVDNTSKLKILIVCKNNSLKYLTISTSWKEVMINL